MDRRSFVRTSVIGVTGIGLFKNNMLSPAEHAARPDTWLRSLATALDARTLTATSLFTTSELAKSKLIDAYFAARGYHRESKRVWCCAGLQDCLFYPLYLRQSKAAITDILVLVFIRNQSGEWLHAATLTGFQIEALVRAATGLSESIVPIRDLLLPVYSGTAMVNNGNFYTTSRGAVSIKTRVEPGVARTEITVLNGENQVFSEVFVSRHTLTGSIVPV